ncbi:MAG: MFS transporter [Mycobacteriaceae bacterium]|nr:MFS transporter [Mycobacteriaceae bacterium]
MAIDDISVPVARQPLERQAWVATSVMLVAVLMELMDVTMANVAIPSIRAELHASYGQTQWVVAGYSLAMAVALLTGGRLGDRWGRKRMFLTGLVAFIATSALSGLAPDPGLLIVGRVLQGLAAAIMLPQVLACISVWFPENRRAAAFGLFGAVVGLGGVTAPLVGGVLIDADLFGWGWRPIFLINVPIGIVCLAATLLFVAESVDPARPRLDIVGALIAAAGVFLVVFPLIQGRDNGWPLWGWLLLAGAGPAFALFVRHARHRARRARTVVADLSLLRSRVFAGGLLVTLVLFGGVTATAFIVMIYLQTGFGYSPVRAGLALVSMALAFVVGSGASVRLSAPIGHRVLQLGCLTSGCGLVWLAVVVGRHHTALTIWDIVAPLAAFGFGLGLVVAPLTDFILADVAPEHVGAASGLQSTIVQVGNTVGVAVIGTIFLDMVADAPAMRTADAIRAHWAHSMQYSLYVDAAVFVITFGLVFLMGRNGRQDRSI